MNHLSTPTLVAVFSAAFVATAPAAQATLSPEELEADAPHIAVAQEADGSFALEFEVAAGLDLSTPVPTLTLDVSAFDPFFGGFRTFPVNDTPSPNDDLGFVSEVEGAAEEGAALGADISVRLLSSDEGFAAFFGADQIFTPSDPVFNLGNAFDTHPTYVLLSDNPDFTGSVGASFEVFETASGAVIGGYNLVLDTQPIPEPTTAVLAGAMGLLVLRRRRSA